MSEAGSASTIGYLDFDLEIGEGSGRDYPLTVVRSPAGEARAVMQFPYDDLALKNQLLSLENALLRSVRTARRLPTPEQQTVQRFGRDLFEALLSGDVRSRYDVSLRQAETQAKRLRLRLRFQTPQLAALPWEFLYDARLGEYLVLSKSLSIVRYQEIPQPTRTLAVRPPLRILGMVAGPSDLAVLDVTHERQRVETALAHLTSVGLVEVTWLAGSTWRDLQRAMRGGPWHIFHFIGHGGFDPAVDEGVIAMANDDGKAAPTLASEVGRLLAGHPSLRLVVLNACQGAEGSEHDLFSSTAATLVRRGIPAVIAMRYEISDEAAVEFSRGLYEALADGWPVDAAVAEARIGVSLGLRNTLEWGTPVLYMRSSDGALFRLAQTRRPGDGVASRPAEVPSQPDPLRPAAAHSRAAVRHSRRTGLALVAIAVAAAVVIAIAVTVSHEMNSGRPTAQAARGATAGPSSPASPGTVRGTTAGASSPVSSGSARMVTVFAGSGAAGYADGQGRTAQFDEPSDVAVDAAGTVYVADTMNHCIRSVDRNGDVHLLAGTCTHQGFKDGSASSAMFNQPRGVAVGKDGTVYVADTFNHSIRKVTAGGEVTTFAGSGTAGNADGQGQAARFNLPSGIAVDAAGIVYVADSANNRIRRIDPGGNVITLVVSRGGSDSSAAADQLNSPIGIAVDRHGNLYVADRDNNRVHKLSQNGTSIAYSVDTRFEDVRVVQPWGIAVDDSGTIYATEYYNHRVVQISPDATSARFAGSGNQGVADGPAANAEFNLPRGVAVGADGTVYVADTFNHQIRKIAR